MTEGEENTVSRSASLTDICHFLRDSSKSCFPDKFSRCAAIYIRCKHFGSTQASYLCDTGWLESKEIQIETMRQLWVTHDWFKNKELFAPMLWKGHSGTKLLQPSKNDLLLWQWKCVRTAERDTCYQGLLHFNQCVTTKVCSRLMPKTGTKTRRQLLGAHIKKKVCILHEKTVLWSLKLGHETIFFMQPHNYLSDTKLSPAFLVLWFGLNQTDFICISASFIYCFNETVVCINRKNGHLVYFS